MGSVNKKIKAYTDQELNNHLVQIYIFIGKDHVHVVMYWSTEWFNYCITRG